MLARTRTKESAPVYPDSAGAARSVDPPGTGRPAGPAGPINLELPDPHAPLDGVTAGNALLDAIQLLGSSADELPCRVEDYDLWFAEVPAELDRAKQLCGACPIRQLCLEAALARREPWGVWGGSIFDHGVVIAQKRPRGRPRKEAASEVAA